MKEGDEPLICSSQAPITVGALVRTLVPVGLAVALLSACTATQPQPGGESSAALPPAPTVVATMAPTAVAMMTATASVPEVAETAAETVQALASEIVVYAADLPEGALSDELAFWDDPASPAGKMIGIPNTGDELDPPPENDPAITFEVAVHQGIPYRCWIHMKVGAPMGKSQANVLWAQFSDSVNADGDQVYRPGSGSYLTAQGPEEEGWVWVGCDPDDTASDPLVQFGTNDPITVRIQAGMEGVGFDQFLLSPAHYLENAPSEAVVEK